MQFKFALCFFVLAADISHAMGSKHRPQKTYASHQVAEALIDVFNDLIGPPFGPSDCLKELSDSRQIAYETNLRLPCARLGVQEVGSLLRAVKVENINDCYNLFDFHQYVKAKCNR